MRRKLTPLFPLSLVLFLFSCDNRSIDPTEEDSASIGTNVSEALSNCAEDPRFSALVSFLGNLNYQINETDAIIKDSQTEPPVLLVMITDENKENIGIFSVKNDNWSFTVKEKNTINAYDISIGINDSIDISEQTLKKPNNTEVIPEDGLGKDEYAISSYGVCQYISRVIFTFACWEPDGNPFGYGYYTTTRVGDPISWNHYTMRQDWRGIVHACPLKEVYWSPFVIFNCGFPPS